MIPLPIMNPVEVVKTRLQLQGELANSGAPKKYRGMVHGIIQIARDEGIAGLYKGLTPALMREGVYASIRFGCYEPLKVVLGEDATVGGLPLYKKIIAGAIAGGIGAAIATPTDVVKVQMQAEGAVAVPRYKNTADAFGTIWRKEGLQGLYRGILPTTQRACVISAAMLPSYDHTKHFLLQKGWVREDNVLSHIISGMTAGFVMASVTSPVDVVKTRVMNQKPIVKEGGIVEMPYKGSLDCFAKTLRAEGPFGFYKGFIPNFMRLGPHTIMAFISFEQLRKLAGIKPV